MHEFESPSLPRSYLFKPSSRTLSEQTVGLVIFLMGFFSLEIFHRSFVEGPFLFRELGWTAYYFLILSSMWTLWRRFSLKTIKLEFAGFVLALLPQVIWSCNFFGFKEALPVLFALTLLWCNNLVATLLFWKKEKISGALFFLPFLWSLYVMGENMIKCISTP